MLISEWLLEKKMLIQQLDPDKIKQLADTFEINQEQFLVYFTILQNPGTIISNVCRKLDFDRGRTYRAVDHLERLGFLSKTMSNPSHVTAKAPIDVLDLVSKRHEITLMTLQSEKMEKLLEEITITNKNEVELAATTYISGMDNYFAALLSKILLRTENLTMYLSQKTLKKIYYTRFPELLKKHKVKVKILSNDLGLVKRLQVKNIRKRQSDYDYDIVVADNDVIIQVGMIRRSEHTANTGSIENYMHSTNRFVASICEGYLENLWDAKR